jgi:hypothetical protein
MTTCQLNQEVSKRRSILSLSIKEPDEVVEFDSAMELSVDCVEALTGKTEAGRGSWIEVFEDLELEFGSQGEEMARFCGSRWGCSCDEINDWSIRERNCLKEDVDILSIEIVCAGTLDAVGDETGTGITYRILGFLIASTNRTASLLVGFGGHFQGEGENYSTDTEG